MAHINNKQYPIADLNKVFNNYSIEFTGTFTSSVYKQPLGKVFFIHKEDRKTILEINEVYLPII